MDKKFRRLYLYEIAFNLIPQPLFGTKANIIRESRKRNMILEMSMPSCRMCFTIIMVHRTANHEIMFLFTDPMIFHLFAQNHCYSIKLKAILNKYNI